jgi:hypothetical protein
MKTKIWNYKHVGTISGYVNSKLYFSILRQPACISLILCTLWPSVMGVLGRAGGIFWVLVLNGRFQDEECTRCGSPTNSKLELCDMCVTGYLHM